MKIKTYILPFFMIFFGLAFGQDAGIRNIVSISSSFSPVQIEAYRESADKKIQDFYSYLNLLSDTAVSENTKNEVKETVLLLFKNSRTEIVDFTSDNKKTALSEVLKRIESKKIKFRLTDTKGSSSKLSQDFWLSEYSVEVELNGKKSIKTISQKIYFSPVYKQFGNTYKEVWEIRFGEME